MSNVDPSKRRCCYQKKSLSIVEPKVSCLFFSNLSYKQTHCTRAGIDTKGRQTNTLHDGIDTKVRQTDLDQQARHLLVIFENLEATLKTETTFSNLKTTVIVSKARKEVEVGDSIQ